MNRPVNVLILLNSLAPYGAETFVLNFCRHVDRSRFEVSVAYLGGAKDLSPSFENMGVTVHNLSSARYSARSPLGRGASVLNLYSLLRTNKFDILQAHIAYSTVVARAVGRAARVPVIVTTEQSPYRDPDYPGWLRHAMDATYKWGDGHVFISQAVRESCRAVFPSIEGPVITNGIDAEDIAQIAAKSRTQVRRDLGLDDSTFAFGQVARLTQRKGQIDAIEALARVVPDFPNTNLFFVGAGRDEAALKDAVSRHGLSNQIHFLGQRLDVHRVLGGFDACLHPAHHEGLGIAVLEAMAAGLPTIAARVGGIPEFVHDGETGWLTEAADVDGIAEAMKSVLKDRVRAAEVARDGQAFVRANYDIGAAVQAYSRYYENLMASAKR